jgi:hypothetical protein
MAAGPVSAVFCLLAISTGAMFFCSGASGALPGSLDVLSTSDESPPDWLEELALGRSVGSVDSVAPGSEAAVSPLRQAEPQGVAPLQTSIPCLHGSYNDMLSDSISGASPCKKPSDSQPQFSIRLGSRIGTQNGLLGQLDGIRVDYRLGNGLQINGVAGYPVLSSGDKFNTASQMFGINAVTGKIAQAWDLNSYLVEQQDGEQVTSRSVGTALRYLQPGRSLLVFLDYDFFQNSLDYFMTSGAVTLPQGTTLSATLDIRNSKVPRHQQEYIQQTMGGGNSWHWILPDNRIDHYTGDRSNKISTLALGLAHTFSRRFRINGDLAVMEVSSHVTPNDSKPAAALPSEYFHHLELSGTDMFVPGDKNILDIRHWAGDSARTVSAFIEAKYPLSESLTISPRLSADYCKNTPDNSDRWVTAPTLKAEYLLGKHNGLQLQAGSEWSARESPDGDESRHSFFANLQYKAQF